MNILLLNQLCEPEPTLKGLVFARELAERGHGLEVLTGFPNYPEGNLYPGYRMRPWQREFISGISITRVPLYPSHDRSAIRRALNYTSFAVTSAMLGPALLRRPDIVYVYLSMPTLGLPALAFRLFRGAPFVIDVQDLWPDSVSLSGMLSNTTALKLLGGWCDFVYRQAAHIVVLSPGFKRILIERGVPEKKLSVIYNWCDESAMRPLPRDEELAHRLGMAGRFNFVFAGTMGTVQDLDTILDAARICRDSAPAAQFVFVGGGVEAPRLERKARDMALTNVLFLPKRPIEAMGPIFAIADVLLVHLADHPLFEITIPSKTQAYLAAGRPVLMGVKGDAADLIRNSGAGLACEPGNPSSLAQRVHEFVAMTSEERKAMGERGLEYYYRELSVRAGAAKFEAVFREVLSGLPRETLSDRKEELIVP